MHEKQCNIYTRSYLHIYYYVYFYTDIIITIIKLSLIKLIYLVKKSK